MGRSQAPFPTTVRILAQLKCARCGSYPTPTDKVKPAGLTGYVNLIGQRARMEGFIV
jgi:hypothetical protein